MTRVRTSWSGRGAARRPLAALAALAVAALTTLAALLASAVPASATTTVPTAVTTAADALQSGESVYVDPAADPTLTTAQADQLRAQIKATGNPFFVAVLPTSAAVGGSAEATIRALRDEVGLSGTYAVYLGNTFIAGDTRGKVGDLATTAYRDNKDAGPYAVLTAFVASAGERITGKSGVPVNTGAVGAVLLGGAAIVGGGGYWIYRRTKKANAEKTAAVRRTVDEDVTSYGEVVARIDTDDPRLDDAGRADAQRALDAYETAKRNAELMKRPEDASTVTTALEDGRYALACVEARLAGEALPERRPPCFVDPRHGPSVEDVVWSPDGGAARPVPVCAACATTLNSGQLPAAREVTVGGARVPYWQGGRAYAPYAGGYYANSGADMMSAIFIGSMLGGVFSGPTYVDSSGGGGGGGWGSGGGSDFDGGGFGGGGDF